VDVYVSVGDTDAVYVGVCESEIVFVAVGDNEYDDVCVSLHVGVHDVVDECDTVGD
jgi:hypothetical protein